ncbi:MAG: 4Fe-4S binding protein [Desulfosudaceae bacterium]
MSLQAKKIFAVVDYEVCNPDKCDPDKGRCAAVPACAHKVIKQIDGPFEPPMIFQDMCLGCWDCMEACPLDAINMKQVS